MDTKTAIPRVAVLLFLCFVEAGLQIAGAQRIAELPVDSVLRGRSFAELSSFEFSPNGKWLAYVVKDNGRTTVGDLDIWIRTGVPMWISGSDIWISNVETGATRNLTEGQGQNWLAKWSPDGHYLAFLSDRDAGGQAKLWLWDAQKNLVKKLSEATVRADMIEWTPDAFRERAGTMSGPMYPWSWSG